MVAGNGPDEREICGGDSKSAEQCGPTYWCLIKECVCAWKKLKKKWKLHHRILRKRETMERRKSSKK